MITKTVDVVKEFAAAIAAAVDEQGMATEDIARNIHQAATRTQAVKGIIGEVNEAAGETGRSAASMLSAVDELTWQSETLRTVVDKFLAEVRAAWDRSIAGVSVPCEVRAVSTSADNALACRRSGA